jgi:hypothetical protein
LSGALALASCKAHKQMVATRQPESQPVVSPVNAPVHVVSPQIAAIRAKQLIFNTFAGKAKTKLDINGDKNDVTLNIRIERDKRIWVSITAILGIEAARAMITPDSILIINKLQGVYTRKPFSYVYQYAGNQVNFKTIQAMLIGNAIPELLNNDATVGADNANTIISGQLMDMMYKLIVGPDYKVSQTNLGNPAAALNLQVTNSAFMPAENRGIPSQIDIVSAAGDKKINVSMHYNTADFDKPLDFPFSIPGGYTPVD